MKAIIVEGYMLHFDNVWNRNHFITGICIKYNITSFPDCFEFSFPTEFEIRLEKQLFI